MGVNCLSCGPLSQQKRSSIIGLNFHSLKYKQRTDFFHCLSTVTLFVLLLTLLMELFSNRAFVELEDITRNKLNSIQIIFKVGDVIRQILFSWWMLFKSFNNSSLNSQLCLTKKVSISDSMENIIVTFLPIFSFFT